MAKSRYADLGIIDGKSFRSYRLPRHSMGLKPLDLLEGVRTFDYVFSRGDRLDHLAARYFGEDDYWWVIALVNGINYPFSSGGLTPGRVLRIPQNVKDVLDKLLR